MWHRHSCLHVAQALLSVPGRLANLGLRATVSAIARYPPAHPKKPRCAQHIAACGFRVDAAEIVHVDVLAQALHSSDGATDRERCHSADRP